MSGALGSFRKTGLEWWFHPWRSRKYVTCSRIPHDAAAPASPPNSVSAIADDELRVIEVTPYDYRRMSELLTTYSSLRLQAVDACVVALAERLDLHEIAALDRRDFQVVAPRHLRKGDRLRLLPDN